MGKTKIDDSLVQRLKYYWGAVKQDNLKNDVELYNIVHNHIAANDGRLSTDIKMGPDSACPIFTIISKINDDSYHQRIDIQYNFVDSLSIMRHIKSGKFIIRDRDGVVNDAVNDEEFYSSFLLIRYIALEILKSKNEVISLDSFKPYINTEHVFFRSKGCKGPSDTDLYDTLGFNPLVQTKYVFRSNSNISVLLNKIGNSVDITIASDTLEYNFNILRNDGDICIYKEKEFLAKYGADPSNMFDVLLGNIFHFMRIDKNEEYNKDKTLVNKILFPISLDDSVDLTHCKMINICKYLTSRSSADKLKISDVWVEYVINGCNNIVITIDNIIIDSFISCTNEYTSDIHYAVYLNIDAKQFNGIITGSIFSGQSAFYADKISTLLYKIYLLEKDKEVQEDAKNADI